MVCTVFLKCRLPTSLRSRAKRMGAGKPNSRLNRLMARVFFSVRQKKGPVK